MPTSAPKPCRHAGCGVLVRDGSGYCADHQSDRKTNTFADPHRGSRHARGYGSAWDKTRTRILQRDHSLCQECARQGLTTVVGLTRYSAFVDHIIPKAEGGADADDNLQTLCRACHDAKTAAEAARGIARTRPA